jgi:hypothetical protein
MEQYPDNNNESALQAFMGCCALTAAAGVVGAFGIEGVRESSVELIGQSVVVGGAATIWAVMKWKQFIALYEEGHSRHR